MWMDNKQIEEMLNSLGITMENATENIPLIRVTSHFNGNDGYYHVQETDSETVLLKGIHKDFVRAIRGKSNHDAKTFSKISDIMSQVAKNVDTAFIADFQADDAPVLVGMRMADAVQRVEDKRQFLMRRPLASVEYNMGKDDFAGEKMLYSKGLTAALFPETLSPLTASMIKRVLEILNPFFMHANFKTFSPSIKVMFNKLYANYSNLDVIFRTVKMDESFLQLNYAPHLYIKNQKAKLKRPDMKLLDINVAEIEEFMVDIESGIQSLSFDDLSGEKVSELLSMVTMSGTMVFFLMSDAFISLRQRCSSWSDALQLIYKTRSNSIFATANGTEIPEYLDFYSDILPINFQEIPDPVEKQEMINRLPAKTRMLHKGTILKSLEAAHFALDLRDRLFTLSNAFVRAGQDVLIKTGEGLVKDCKFSIASDLQFFEIKELSDIVNDNFFGNIPFTRYFKHWQAERFQMQPMPSEIYEKDIADTPDVIQKLYQKLSTEDAFPCVSYFHQETNGVGRAIDATEGNVVIERTVPVAHLDKLRKADAVVVENSSLFSYLTEYAAIMDIPLYTGVRFAPQLIGNTPFRTAENRIILKRASM